MYSYVCEKHRKSSRLKNWEGLKKSDKHEQ